MVRPRIYADFNNQDEQGHLRLNTMGSLEDLRKLTCVASEGMEVVLYDETFDYEAILIAEPDGSWKARIVRVIERPVD